MNIKNTVASGKLIKVVSGSMFMFVCYVQVSQVGWSMTLW